MRCVTVTCFTKTFVNKSTCAPTIWSSLACEFTHFHSLSPLSISDCIHSGPNRHHHLDLIVAYLRESAFCANINCSLSPTRSLQGTLQAKLGFPSPTLASNLWIKVILRIETDFVRMLNLCESRASDAPTQSPIKKGAAKAEESMRLRLSPQ